MIKKSKAFEFIEDEEDLSMYETGIFLDKSKIGNVKRSEDGWA